MAGGTCAAGQARRGKEPAATAAFMAAHVVVRVLEQEVVDQLLPRARGHGVDKRACGQGRGVHARGRGRGKEVGQRQAQGRKGPRHGVRRQRDAAPNGISRVKG